MKLLEFVKKYSNEPLINSSTFALVSENPQGLRCDVQYWRKKGHHIPLKRGIYVLSNDLHQQPLSMGFIANNLLSPSYLSLEYALSYYDLIPEKVTVYTSVTTKRLRFSKRQLASLNIIQLKKTFLKGSQKPMRPAVIIFSLRRKKPSLTFSIFIRSLKVKQENLSHIGFRILKS